MSVACWRVAFRSALAAVNAVIVARGASCRRCEAQAMSVEPAVTTSSTRTKWVAWGNWDRGEAAMVSKCLKAAPAARSCELPSSAALARHAAGQVKSGSLCLE
jgi:hypothetical protein